MPFMVKDKLPEYVIYAFIDADPIAYRGACSVEKTLYRFKKKGEEVYSQDFESASDAAAWLSDLETLGIGDPDEWERESFKRLGTLEQAIKNTESELQKYLKQAGPHIKRWKGFLTQSGTKKIKDVGGLEHRYQASRPDTKPTYLEECRTYLMQNSNIVMSPAGFEADALVIYNAERYGKKAVLLSIDKDLRQAEGCWVIDMSYAPPKRKAWRSDAVGGLWKCPIKNKVVGVGFMWLCLQAIAGDRADGYFGVKGKGDTFAKRLLEGCTTKEECIKVMLDFYGEHYKDGHSYTSWDGQKVTKTPYELLEQHIWLAHQERGPKDVFKLEDYINDKG